MNTCLGTPRRCAQQVYSCGATSFAYVAIDSEGCAEYGKIREGDFGAGCRRTTVVQAFCVLFDIPSLLLRNLYHSY